MTERKAEATDIDREVAELGDLLVNGFREAEPAAGREAEPSSVPAVPQPAQSQPGTPDPPALSPGAKPRPTWASRTGLPGPTFVPRAGAPTSASGAGSSPGRSDPRAGGVVASIVERGPSAAAASAEGRGRRPGAVAPAELPPTITVDELAVLLRVERKSAYAAVARGEIPGVRRIGRAIRICRDAVLQWLRQGGVAHRKVQR
jgi:excisionase family DNA binding protein